MSDSVWPHRRQPTRLPRPGILQARTLEWVAISFSNAWKWKVKVKLLGHVRLLASPWTAAYQAPPPMGFMGIFTHKYTHGSYEFMLRFGSWFEQDQPSRTFWIKYIHGCFGQKQNILHLVHHRIYYSKLLYIQVSPVLHRSQLFNCVLSMTACVIDSNLLNSIVLL